MKAFSACMNGLAAVALLAIGACQDVTVTAVPVGRIVIEPEAVTLQLDGTTRLSATVMSGDGQSLPGRQIAWSSLEENVALVDGDGIVTAVGVGNAKIRASSEGAMAEADVVVTVGPAVAAAPLQIAFSAPQNGATPGDRTISITNGGTGVLNGLSRSIRYAPGAATGWLSASLAGSSAPTNLLLSVNHAGLAPGSHQAFVDITSPVAPNTVTVTVTLTVTSVAVPPAISLSTGSVSFTAIAGGSNPAQQQVTISNGGGGALTGLVTAIEYTSGQSGWLNAVLSGTTAPAQLTLLAATGSLPAGQHTARVLVSSAAAQNSPQQITVTFTVSAQAAPGVPGNLNATPVSTSAIDLSWSASSGVVQRYRIQRRPATGGSYILIDSVAAGTTTYRDTGLLLLTGYTYRVQACNAGGCSGWSNEATATTLTGGAPARPTNVEAEALSPRSVELSWTPPGGQTFYGIRRRTGNGGPWTFETTVPGEVSRWVNSELSPNTTYQYQIRACSPAGCSQYSPQVTVRTPNN